MNRSLAARALPLLRTFSATLALVGGAVFVDGCSRRAGPAASVTAPTTTPGALAGPAASAATPDDSSPAAARGNLAQRLAAEAAGRRGAAASGPRVEDVATALRRAGVAVTSPSQVLARTIDALYCAAASTPAGLALAVCEFADEAGAERGLAYSHRTFDRLVPGRTLLRNRSTVLTLSGGDAGAAPAAEATRVSSVFAAL